MNHPKQFIISLIVTAGALYYTLHNVSLSDLARSFADVNYIYMIPAVLLMAFSYVCRCWRWRILLSPMKPVDTKGLFSPLMVGYMGNILPARAGEILRPYLVSKKYDIPFSGALATIVVERVFDIAILLLFFIWVFVFNANLFSSEAVLSGMSVQDLALNFGQIAGAFALLIFVFIFGLLFYEERVRAVLLWMVSRLPEKWHEKVEFLLSEFKLGVMVLKDWGALGKIIFLTTLEWFVNIYSMYPLYWAYNIQDKSQQSVILLTVMIAIMVTVLPTPALLGSFNAGVTIALHDVMHETEIAAAGLGMAGWGLNFLVIFLAGTYFIFHDSLSVKQLFQAEAEGEKEKESLEHEK
ncbi:MAG: flippase-like domain-containing protein [Candidatus Nitrohelix vancouverensis]|uniref:Flippase-like domain-containing protein n=1 Tax=Candidatus Nitrohelix vancouverensis TaxID=2705534 RepID=A0A7T0C159_9BACT|nr:MAG: flippase-like domain-containing protein [Candidatus Nitrohelix vancouverensis]